MKQVRDCHLPNTNGIAERVGDVQDDTDGRGLEPHPQVPSINAFPAPSPQRFRDAAIQMLRWRWNIIHWGYSNTQSMGWFYFLVLNKHQGGLLTRLQCLSFTLRKVVLASGTYHKPSKQSNVYSRNHWGTNSSSLPRKWLETQVPFPMQSPIWELVSLGKGCMSLETKISGSWYKLWNWST